MKPARYSLQEAGTALLFCLVMIVAAVRPVQAQERNGSSPPPTAQLPAVPDSNLAVLDTTSTGLDAPIHYDARIIDNDLVNRITVFMGEAVVKYQNMTIEAGKITVDMKKRSLVAEAVAETLRTSSDSLGVLAAPADSVEMHIVGLPVLIDGSDRIVGEYMEYNFDTGKGLMQRGRTEFDGGHFSGKAIKRVASNTLNVSNGTYTTCSLESSPHFHFWARRMKLVLQERVIAKPIVLYFGKLPVAVLPFAMFPTQTGRRSGLIIPKYGQSFQEGRFLRDLGYYWAISDYMDARVGVDFYEKSGWLLRGNFNYALRYAFRGSVSGSITRQNFGDTGQLRRRWDLRVSHNQEIDKTSRFTVSGNFISDNTVYKDLSFDIDQRLQRRINSQASYSKNWIKSRTNLTVNLSEDRDVESGEITRWLPRLSFNYSERPIFGRGGTGTGVSSRTGSGTPKWYQNIYLGYRSSAQSQYTKRLQAGQDSLFNEDQLSFASHDVTVRMNIPNKLFGWLSLSQSMRFDEDWFDRERVFADSSSLTDTETRKGFFARRTFNYSASANTNVYGMFPLSIGAIQAVRHKMTPSVSFTYQPDFSDPKWGYFQEYVDEDGDVQEGDRFSFPGASSTPRGERASLNFSLNNLFQMKTQSGEKEKKFDLFSVNFSSSYNFAAETKKLSRLTTSMRANPARQMSLNVSLSHSPYAFDSDTGIETDSYLWAQRGFWRGGWFRLVSASVTSSIRLNGGSRGGISTVQTQEPEGFGQPGPQGVQGSPGPIATGESTVAGVPWRANLSLSYRISQFNPMQKTKTATLNVSGAEVQLTDKWRLGFRGQFDLRKRQVTGQNWTIYRDIHCWEASLNWTPIGPGTGFYFRINVKASHLQDLKLEKRGGRSSVFSSPF